MDKYPSNQTETMTGHKPKRTFWVIVAVVIILVLAFGLLAYLHKPITGTVIRVNNTSITIRPKDSSTRKTYSVTNTTMMGLPKSAGGGAPQQFNKNDVHVGETVVINVSPNNNQAQAITVNP